MLLRTFGGWSNFLAVYLSTVTSIALLTHKVVSIALHGPFAAWKVVLFGPFTFCFDVITVLILDYGLRSASRSILSFSVFVSLTIIVCSSTTFAVYQEANTEVQWGRSLEILGNWDYLGNFMARGQRRSNTAFLVFFLVGVPFTFLRHAFGFLWQHYNTPIRGRLGRFHNFPFHRLPLFIAIFLSFGALLLPREPWKHMTSPLLFDVTMGLSSIIMIGRNCGGIDSSTGSTHASHFGTGLAYDPKEDPYYVTNLDLDIEPFIKTALKDVKFTHVVEIVLESVRGDCYPFKEDGLFHQFIKENVKPAVNGTPITAKTVTPFIDSLSKQSLLWDQVWSLCPLTNKAMMGFHCGMIGLPKDFGAEIKGNAKYYQTCLAQVLRQINSATDMEDEFLASFNQSITNTTVTDQWMTSHITASSCLWDNHKEMIRRIGYDTIIDAESMQKVHGPKEFGHFQGYWDEDGLEFLWSYVDHMLSRTPRERLYLTWMSQVTHIWLPLNPAWEELNYQAFTEDDPNTASTDLYLNGIRETDDLVKEIILGFRERGLENDTLFVIHGDHGSPFINLEWQGAAENPHNDPYLTSFILYNPNINNPEKQILDANVYGAAIPTTILDVMNHTNSFSQSSQQELAMHYAANYEHSQSFLRPMKESIRFFLVNPGGSQWVLDNGKNLRIRFNLYDKSVYMADYENDPLEASSMFSWEGVEGLIKDGAEEKFGPGTAKFLLEAASRETYMRSELLRRYGLSENTVE